jgi:hypothetical protein
VEAVGDEYVVASAVALEPGAVAMPLKPVELDDQPLLGPEEVRAVAQEELVAERLPASPPSEAAPAPAALLWTW